MSETDALARRLSVSEVVAVYERSEADVRAAFDLLARAERTLNETFCLGEHRTIHVRDRYSHRWMNFEEVEGSLTELRRDVWQALVTRLDLRSMMSVKAWDDLQKQIRDGEPPAIDQETVAGMAQGFRDRMGEMLAEAVEEVFDWLRPRRSEYKTNSELEIGPKVCLAHMVSSAYGLRVSDWGEQRLTALENVFNALDGHGQTTKGYYSELSQAIRNAERAGVGWAGETRLFAFRCFKNGALHLTFKRLDLLARFNQIAGGARLRPAPKGAVA
ncbi:MAG TPA: DUF4942 domain-containing protein [Polyangiaceae bacterium]|nr:DUF4942 domain-containing protein [Polyangiaceae bacterium]